MSRIHNTVKGWGGAGANAGNAIHSYTCSKCHTPHNSRLKRLMVTNCLDYNHRGRVATGGSAGAGSGSAGAASGSGSGHGSYPGGGQSNPGSFNSHRYGFGYSLTCHTPTNADGWPANQKWNTMTLW
jgi:hypothetical protein